MPQVLIDVSVIRQTKDGPRLIGSRCASCDTATFPTQSGCPRCFSDDMPEIELPPTGTLWTFTTQGFPPKAEPEGAYIGPLDPFEPYTVGYVELEGACKVEARLTEPDPAKLTIGQEMQLVLVALNDEVTTFAFAPVSDD
jgi:uncharacterized protein